VQINLYVLDPYVQSLLFVAEMLLSTDQPGLVPVIWENKVVGLRYGTDPAKTFNIRRISEGLFSGG
jgi:hypothetical protein